MSALSAKLRSAEGGRISFWCPACDRPHTIRVAAPSGPNWTFDGNAEQPTFSPSILVTYYAPDADQMRDGHRAPSARCHSFVRKGMIEFCGDCSHELSGKTVPLPDWPAGWGDE